jgi:hypothetical protein
VVALFVLALLADRGVDIANHRSAAGLRDAQRLVEQVDDRQPVARALVLHFGKRGDDQQYDERAKRQRHHPPPAAQAAQAAEAEPPHRRQQPQQQQIPRTVEDEHGSGAGREAGFT